MDLITQGILGAAAAQIVSPKKFQTKAWFVGFLSGMAADADIFIRSKQNPLLLFYFHRHFTHSLFFIPFGGILCVLLILVFLKSYRPWWRETLFCSIAAFATHGILDACTSYGTLLWWPFSLERVAWDWISIIDPIFTFVLLIGVISTRVFDSRKFVVISLLFCLSYIGLGALQHHRALQVQNTLAQERHQIIKQGRVFPTLGNIIVWRSAYIFNHTLASDDITVWPRHIHTKFLGNFPVTDFENLAFAIKNNPSLLNAFNVFNWFADGYLITVKTQPLILVDGRYLIGTKTIQGLWGLEFVGKSGSIVRNITLVPLKNS